MPYFISFIPISKVLFKFKLPGEAIKYQVILAIVILTTLTSTYAAEESQLIPIQSNTAPAVSGSENQISKQHKLSRFVFGGGFTFGGDTLGTIFYTDGSSDSITAGGGLLIHAGLDCRLSENISLQGTLGYHFDTTKLAGNGELTFNRFPVDLLAYYHASDAIRIGGGTRIVFSPKMEGSGIAASDNLSFDNTIGVVIEGEYTVLPTVGIKLRYVTEKYSLSGSPFTIDGNHVGLLINLYL